jgi:mono/diheme cytochrome c family protein
LKTGMAQGVGVASGPMAETIHDSLSQMTDADLAAIVAYLKSTPSKAGYQGRQDSAFAGPTPVGREVYLNDCTSCHQLDGKGIPNAVAALAGDGTVLAGGPQDVIRVILGGIEAHGTDAPMPAIGVGMSDRDIADVTNYVRQAWGNDAPATAAPGLVGDLRKSTRTTMNLGVPCPPISQPAIAAAVADPNAGLAGALASMDLGNVLQTVRQVVPKAKQAAPEAAQADIVNALSEAYCPIIAGEPNLTYVQKVSRFNNFSERVYGAMTSSGKD